MVTKKPSTPPAQPTLRDVLNLTRRLLPSERRRQLPRRTSTQVARGLALTAWLFMYRTIVRAKVIRFPRRLRDKDAKGLLRAQALLFQAI